MRVDGEVCGLDGVSVTPSRGDAVLFYNLNEEGAMEGAVDEWSLHAGCAVVEGVKYIANLWIRNKRVDGKLYSSVW